MNWEYHTIKLRPTGFLSRRLDVQELDDSMNQLGEEGWELAAAFDTHAFGEPREVVVVFKRPRD